MYHWSPQGDIYTVGSFTLIDTAKFLKCHGFLEDVLSVNICPSSSVEAIEVDISTSVVGGTGHYLIAKHQVSHLVWSQRMD